MQVYDCLCVQASVHLYTLHVYVCVCTYVYVCFRLEKCIMMYKGHVCMDAWTYSHNIVSLHAVQLMSYQ